MCSSSACRSLLLQLVNQHHPQQLDPGSEKHGTPQLGFQWLQVQRPIKCFFFFFLCSYHRSTKNFFPLLSFPSIMPL